MQTSTTEKLVSHLILITLSVLAVLPILGLAFAAFNGSGRPISGIEIPSLWTLENFYRAWAKGKFGQTLWNSAAIALIVVVGTTVLSALAGYAFAVLRFRGKNVIFVLFLIGLVVPGEAMIVPLYYDIREFFPFLRGNYGTIALPQIGKFLAFGVFWMRTAFAAIPSEMTEAARLDGAGSVEIFRSILLPLVRPALLTLAVLVFMWSWNDFLLPLVMLANSPRLQTAPLSLAAFSGQRLTDVVGLSAAALIVSVPIIAFYLVFQRQLVRGVLQGALQ
ncbi:MAG: binding-protein-dependent transport system inner rane component [Devosia sp.]|nr:binding-protein-dependent transport system inner rane component [Devosia sp.]